MKPSFEQTESQLDDARKELARLRGRQLELALGGRVIESAQFAEQARILREKTAEVLAVDPACC